VLTHTPIWRNPAEPITEEELDEIEQRAVDYPHSPEILALCREVRVLLSMSAPKKIRAARPKQYREEMI
jgi:hypothetical protein